MKRFALIFGVLGLALAGCGGGGDSGGSVPPSAAPPPVLPPPVVATATFNRTSISHTAINNSGRVFDDSITFSVTFHSGTIYYRYRQTGVIVDELTMSYNQTSSTGTVLIRLINAERLGAGTYASQVTLEMCADQACTSRIGGTPVEIAVNYVVTGSAVPSTSVSWVASEPYGLLEYETQVTQAPTFELRANLTNVPLLIPLYIGRTESQTGLITAMTFTPPPAGTPLAEAHGTFQVTLKPPSTLGSGIFTDSVTVRVCLDTACVTHVNGSPFELKPAVIVLATEGEHLTRISRAPEHGAQAIAWSPATQRLYVGSSNQQTLAGPTAPADVLALDPATLQTTASLTLNTGVLDKLAVSGDGNGLFVSSRWAKYVHHLQLPTLANDFTIDAGEPVPDMPLSARSLLPLAGQPNSVLISLHSWDEAAGIKVYDSMTPRATGIVVTPPGERANPVVRGATAGSYYAYRQPRGSDGGFIDRLSVAAGGVTRAMSVPVSYSVENLQHAGGLLYDERGNAIDPATGAIVRSLDLPDEFELQDFIVDAAHDRLFARVVRGPQFTRPYLMSFVLGSFEQLAIARLVANEYELSTLGKHMALWGSEGLALSDGERVVALSGQFFTTYDGSPTVGP